jgi:hypothetical protein
LAYAAFTDVQARAGRVAAAFSVTGRRPNQADVESFLDDVASEINARLRSRGFDPALLDKPAELALRGTNADGALVLALEAAFPGGVPADVEKVYTGARDRYNASLGLLESGRHAAFVFVESASGSPSGSSLWSDDPTYGEVDLPPDEQNPNLAPFFSRGMKL